MVLHADPMRVSTPYIFVLYMHAHSKEDGAYIIDMYLGHWGKGKTEMIEAGKQCSTDICFSQKLVYCVLCTYIVQIWVMYTQ